MKCSKCSKIIDADSHYCDKCGFAVSQPTIGKVVENKSSFVEVLQPLNHQELALTKMILDRESIHYYVNNELGSRWVSAFFSFVGAGAMRVFVQADKAGKAKDILNK